MFKINFLTSFFISVVLCSCTGGKQNPRLDQREERDFSFGALSDNGFSIFKSESSKKKDDLWNASLEVIKEFPIQTSDYNGGILSTDWHTKNDKNIREKILIKIKDNSDITVSVFKQVFVNNQWVDKGRDQTLEEKLSKNIIS
ncbi:MAG: DUF3576 domain-containing protein [Proteobacteria bacterium]|nr:DUF3576 domain-containing protein [Pseudomonadota bacterium]